MNISQSSLFFHPCRCSSSPSITLAIFSSVSPSPPDHTFNQLFRQKTKVRSHPLIMKGEKAQRRIEAETWRCYSRAPSLPVMTHGPPSCSTQPGAGEPLGSVQLEGSCCSSSCTSKSGAFLMRNHCSSTVSQLVEEE